MIAALALCLTCGILQRSSPALEALTATAGIEVDVVAAKFEVSGADYKISGTAPTSEHLDKYLALFTKEWALYPAKLFAKANVKRLVFAENLAVNGQFRGAVPAFDFEAMYYDPSLGSYNPHWQRVVIHHELFHMIDQRMKLIHKDPEWMKLNLPDFHYGKGGKEMRTRGVGELTDRIPGFLTPYGMSAIEEDKAELYGHLIVDREFVNRRIAVDPWLAKKVDLLRMRLRGYLPELAKLIE